MMTQRFSFVIFLYLDFISLSFLCSFICGKGSFAELGSQTKDSNLLGRLHSVDGTEIQNLPRPPVFGEYKKYTFYLLL